MSFLLSIDPGTRCIGWAYWGEGKLISCGRSTAPKKLKDYRDMLEYHRAQMKPLTPLPGSGDVACEVMVHRYGGGGKGKKRKKVDPNDLIRVNLIAGALGTSFFEPSDWKGGISREMEQARTWLELSASEKKLLPKTLAEIRKHPFSLDHNVFSAVGIGLSVLGRAHLKCGIRRVQ